MERESERDNREMEAEARLGSSIQAEDDRGSSNWYRARQDWRVGWRGPSSRRFLPLVQPICSGLTDSDVFHRGTTEQKQESRFGSF